MKQMVELKEIVKEVKKKRELEDLDTHYVLEKVEKIVKQNKKIRVKIRNANSFQEFARSAEFDELKKRVRAELRAVYGVFDLDEKKKRTALIKRIGTNKTTSTHHADKKERKETIRQLLLLHTSSKERLEYYDEIYTKIFSITGTPTSILDLGCGANPYSYSMLGCRPLYIAMDLPSDDLKDLAEFFRIEKINGKVMAIDLVKDYEKIGVLLEQNPIDVIFLFKLLDSVETVKRNISWKLLDALHARWLVVSFPTISIGGGKAIRSERRAWFEKLLARRQLPYETFSVPNEIFYVIRKKDSEKIS